MPPPIWLMRQAGRYLPEYRRVRETAGDFLALCLTPELASEVTLQPIRRFGFDAAIIFADILIVPYALGQAVAFREGEGPVLEPVASRAALERLELRQAMERASPIFETVRRVRASLPAETALIGFAGSPWTVACYMVEGGGTRDFAAVKRFASGEPAAFASLIDLVETTTLAYLEGQIAAGAQVLQLFDSWAGVLPEEAFRRWVIAPTRRLVTQLKAAHPDVPIIGFPRGAGLMYQAYVEETGVDAVGLDTAVPLFAAVALQRRRPVQGNLDPQLLALGGAARERATNEIIGRLSGGPFVFNLGHGIVPETPPGNVARLVEIVRRSAGS
jgi:uroporphyrinogen decarboxylase